MPGASQQEELAWVPSAHRYELRLDGELAGWVDCRPDGGDTVMAHVEVLAPLQGRGLGGRLVETTLRAIAASGGGAIPVCPFAVAHIARNPELAQLVVPRLRSAFPSPRA